MPRNQNTSWLANAYVIGVVLFGSGVILWSIIELSRHSSGYKWLLLAALTILSGAASIKIQSTPASFSISDTFIFIGALLFGVPVATLIVALDGFVISMSLARDRRELRRVFFNITCPALAVWIGASAFYAILAMRPFGVHQTSLGDIFPALLIFAFLHFSLNSLLVAVVIALHSDQSAATILRREFVWASFSSVASASIAALVVSFTHELTTTFLVVIIPLLILIYVNYKSSLGRIDDAHHHLATLNRLYLSTIEALAMAIDAKDQITHGHIRRVQAYAVGLAKSLGVSDASVIQAIEAAALLHDTGKLAVPEYILNKPGKLTPAEFEKMKLHATVGADILSSVDFPFPVVPIVRHHHENWDGTGYPDALRGTDIPIGARILSVVDCFDALTSDRPYRPRLSIQEAMAIIVERRGTMYDPLIVDTFISVQAAIAPEAPELILDTSHHPRAMNTRVGLSAEALARTTPEGHQRLDAISASVDEMLTLHDLATSLGGQSRLMDVAAIAARHLRRLIPASLYVFYLYDRGQDELAMCHASGHGESLVAGLRIPLGERLSGWVAANRQPILNSDPVLDLGEAARSAVPRLAYCLSSPIVAGDDLVGVLTLYAADNPFTEDHRRVLEAIARQASHTLLRSLEFEQSRAAVTDPLARLPRPSTLRQIASETVTHNASVASLLFIEVERHHDLEAGREQESDLPLTQIAALLKQAMRDGDQLFHHGGGTFVVLLSETDPGNAQEIATRLVNILERFPIAAPSGEAIAVSVSVGLATAPIDGRTPDELLNTARARSRQLRSPNVLTRLTAHLH